MALMRLNVALVTALSAAIVLTSSQARAELSSDTEAAAAKEVLTRYLTAVKGKKYAEAKKLTHPKTLESIAQRLQRLKREDHPMAPWALAKTDSYLMQFSVENVTPSANKTWVVETKEDTFQVQDKGVAEGEMASYLVGKSGGRLYVVDKKRQETFNPTSIKIGYKGYFDPVPPTKEEEE